MPRHLVGRIAFVLLAGAVVCGAAGPADAQVVIDPDIVEFTPSPDHAALNKQGAEVVDFYELWFYLPGTAKPFQTVGLDKPDPASDGKIRVFYRPLLTTMPPPGVLYEARVAASGPGGRSVSVPSNTFSFGGTCSYTVAPATYSFGANGGTTTLVVDAGAGCAWAASGAASWLTVTGSGSGGGTMTLAAAPNGSTTARATSLRVGTTTVTISQAGTSCSYTLAPATVTIPAGGGGGTVSLSTTGSCGWAAVSSAPWLTIVGSGSGTGSATLQFTAAVNTTTSQRSATISAGGKSVTIVQPGVACSYTLGAGAAVMSSAASAGSVTITAPAGCTWTASSNAAWLSVVGWAAGNGSGTIAYEAEANTAGTARAASISAGGQTFSVTQQGAGACSYTLSPGSQVVGTGGGTGSATLTTGAGCAWSAASDVEWISLKGGTSGTGPGTVAFDIAANTTAGGYRVGHISIAGRIFYVWQSPASCSYALSPSTASLPSTASSGSAEMSTPSGCNWAASSTASWLSVTSAAFNSGPATLTFSATANSGSAPRTALIQAGKTSISVTQAGNTSCTFDLAADRVTLDRAAQTATTTVTVTGTCPLAATSGAAWLTVKSVDQGAGTIAYAVTKNDTGLDRSAALRIGSSVLLVVQKSVGLPDAPGGLRVTGLGR